MYRQLIYFLVIFILILSISGCAGHIVKGNGEFYFEYGTKLAIGQHTEKSDDTQIASVETNWGDGPVSWLFQWLLNPPEKTTATAESSSTGQPSNTSNE